MAGDAAEDPVTGALVETPADRAVARRAVDAAFFARLVM